MPAPTPDRTEAETLLDVVDPTAITAEMAQWVRERVPEEGSEEARVRALVGAVTGDHGLELVYNPSHTGTATEVFATRRANCLGFTHLVVGLGREVGLPVYYLTFRQQPKFEREGDLVVVREHVTAGFGPEDDRLVMHLGVGPRFEYEDIREIEDRTAFAMHYSNRGAEMLRAGDLEESRRVLETAVRIDPALAQGWVNLGVLRRRLGDLGGAEEAYRYALSRDPDSFQAYQNLAVLFWLRGRKDAAREMLTLLDRRENQNPFAYLLLGDLSYRMGRPEEARRFYRRAALRAPGSAEPPAALGRLAVQEGDSRRARRLLRRAAKREEDNERVVELREAILALEEERAGRERTP